MSAESICYYYWSSFSSISSFNCENFFFLFILRQWSSSTGWTHLESSRSTDKRSLNYAHSTLFFKTEQNVRVAKSLTLLPPPPKSLLKSVFATSPILSIPLWPLRRQHGVDFRSRQTWVGSRFCHLLSYDLELHSELLQITVSSFGNWAW